eukprot:GHVU01143037.1.p2 GENE.GHVU01143037.1~~GHVU01143037.1.p2  ORF type:complete len:179 (-),score=19.67 GHVU01143037.1:338-874(-)
MQELEENVKGNSTNTTAPLAPVPVARWTDGTHGPPIRVETIEWRLPQDQTSFGAFLFLGNLEAKEWRKARVMHIPREYGFDAFAVTPPGLGLSTNATPTEEQMQSPNYRPAAGNQINTWLEGVIKNILKLRVETIVVVCQSNIWARTVLFPFLEVCTRYGLTEAVTETHDVDDDGSTS